MEKVPSKGAIQSGKKSVQGTVAVQYGKGAVCLKKSAIDNKKKYHTMQSVQICA